MHPPRPYRYRVLVAKGPLPLEPPVQFAISRTVLIALGITLFVLFLIEAIIFTEGIGWNGPLPRLRTALTAYRLAPGESERIADGLAGLRERLDAMTAAQDEVTRMLRVNGPAASAVARSWRPNEAPRGGTP
jgi:hypothetical protein